MGALEVLTEPIAGVPGGALVRLRGAVDGSTAATFDRELRLVREAGYVRLALDFGAVAYVNSTGLGALVKLADDLGRQGGRLVLADVRGPVRFDLDLLGLDALLHVCADAAAATAELRGEAPAPSPAPTAGTARPAVDLDQQVFARIALKRGFCKPEDVARAVAGVKAGTSRDLGAALRTLGVLSAAHAEEVASLCRQVVLACVRCPQRVMFGLPGASRPTRCPSCRGALRLMLPSGTRETKGNEGAGDLGATTWSVSQASQPPEPPRRPSAPPAAVAPAPAEVADWKAAGAADPESAVATLHDRDVPPVVHRRPPHARAPVPDPGPARRGRRAVAVLGGGVALAFGVAWLAGAFRGPPVAPSEVPGPTVDRVPTPAPPAPPPDRPPAPRDAEAELLTIAADARAAIRAGDDGAAGDRFAAADALVPRHPRIEALRSHLHALRAAEKAVVAGEAAAAAEAAARLDAAEADDPRAARLRTRLDLWQRAEAALAARQAGPATAAAQALLAELPGHGPAAVLLRAAAAMAEAHLALDAGDWARAVRATADARAARPGLAWADAMTAHLASVRVAAVQAALGDAELPRAEALAAELAAVLSDAPDVALAQRLVVEARREFDARVAEGTAALDAGRGTEARVAFERALARWRADAVRALLLDARAFECVERARAATAGGAHPAAEEALAEAARLRPADPAIAEALAAARRTGAEGRAAAIRRTLLAGRLDEAAQALADLRARRPDDPLLGTLEVEVGLRRECPAGFVFLPAGDYAVGDEREADNPVRAVRVGPLYVGRFEVTNAEFRAFVAAAGYDDARWWPSEVLDARAGWRDATGALGPAGWRNGAPPQGQEDWPVVGICGHEAAAFARFVGARLPTEAEWEVAAGADPESGRARAYPWGGSWDPSRVGATGLRMAALGATGARNGDRSAMGCQDVAGNAFEWTASPWADGAPLWVVRGGGALAPEPARDCAVSRRHFRGDPAGTRLPVLGFRLVRDP